MGKRVIVNDRMQSGYAYWRTEPVGRNFAPEFTPDLTPKEMLRLGIVGGKYMTDCHEEFPRSWFARATLCAERHDARLNCFGVNASQSLRVRRRSGWIHKQDPRGWFQWYCRYYMGRRPPTMPGRFDAGVRSPGTWRRFESTASRAISNVGGDSDRPSFTGRTTAEKFSRVRHACVRDGCDRRAPAIHESSVATSNQISLRRPIAYLRSRLEISVWYGRPSASARF